MNLIKVLQGTELEKNKLMLKQQHNDLVESQILHEDCDQGAEQGDFDDVSIC